MALPARVRADACPGVFATHDAADGALARVRLPGGRLSASQARVLASCAEELGDGSLHLTSRGNIQLRGLSRTGELVPRLSSAGLLPAPPHERVRNYLASPLSGLTGGLVDVRETVAELDRAVCARPELAGLPGRFLFALDDGRGDVSGEDADVCWRALDSSTGAVLLAGRDTGERVPFDGAVGALVRKALWFTEVRGSAWRVRELDLPGGSRLPASPGVPVGPFTRDDGRAGVCGAPVLGQLAAADLRALGEIVVTPWRSVVVPLGVHAPGLVTDPDAPGLGVSACIGRPGCAKSRADVRADARAVMRRTPAGVRMHFSGCERRCGRPHEAHIDMLAGTEEYQKGTP
ncbi:nitrite/sulfite reductase [Amycolatopsis endophytica]|uniref:Precorrin-3B synthase n=1 Tax=Amycolatopsis endophytica TaxID=860233 RepID=A0A853B5B5_9PSEU|nr:nitrite/sulfite reductase [Amycolatopsis endophytica]NYI89964.1 precorrin-3B synthase [Amycolatopsis endophytica]